MADPVTDSLHCLELSEDEASTTTMTSSGLRQPNFIELAEESSAPISGEGDLPVCLELNGSEVIIAPESDAEGESASKAENRHSERPRPKPISLVFASVTFVLAIVCYLGLRIAMTYGELESAHPRWALAFLSLTIVCTVSLGLYAYQVTRRFMAIQHIEHLQEQICRFLPDPDRGLGTPAASWSESEVRDHLFQCVGSMSARTEDADVKKSIDEWLACSTDNCNGLVSDVAELETNVLSVLDRKADQAIRAASRRVGLGTALASRQFDTLIILWNSLWLVDRMTSIYSGRPSGLGTLFLLFRAARQVLAGELANQAVAGIGGLALGKGLALLGGRASEGAVNAFLMLRMGEALRRSCRPIPPRPVGLASLIRKAVQIVTPVSRG